MDVLLPGQTNPTLNLGTVTPEDNGRKFKLVVSNGVLPNLTKTITINVHTWHPDTVNYLTRVETADGQALEPAIAEAWDVFFRAMDDPAFPTPTAATHKIALAEGTMIPMLGARTLAASLLPLYPDMPMPTNVGFVTGDYDRAVGLERTGGVKYLDTNVLDSDLPQDDFAYGLWMVNTTPHTPSSVTYMGVGDNTSPAFSRMGNGASSADNFFYRNRSSSLANTNDIVPIWLTATSRSSSSQFTAYTRNTSLVTERTSSAALGLSVMAYGSNVGGHISNPGFGLYHSVFVSRSIDLAYMDTCLTTLQSSIAAALS